METYWADSTGRRNTFDHIRFKQAVERFCRRTITQRFARPAIKGMRYSAELIGSVLAVRAETFPCPGPRSGIGVDAPEVP